MRFLNILRTCFWSSLAGVIAANWIYRNELALTLYWIPLIILIPYVIKLLKRRN